MVAIISDFREYMTMPKRVNVECRKLILDDFFKVEEVYLSYERFDGSMSPLVRRLNFERGDSVATLLHHKKRNSILLVNQFKYPSYDKGPGWITEVVAGTIGPEENPEDAARREILEETGYRAEKLVHISTFYVSPGGSSERILLYYAEISGAGRSEKGGGLAEENEDITLIELPADEAFRQVEWGRIVDAKTILGLMWLRNRLASPS
jgi:nudix-type nucleoside diphosphatase (YffH/AdpP family)